MPGELPPGWAPDVPRARAGRAEVPSRDAFPGHARKPLEHAPDALGTGRATRGQQERKRAGHGVRRGPLPVRWRQPVWGTAETVGRGYPPEAEGKALGAGPGALSTPVVAGGGAGAWRLPELLR